MSLSIENATPAVEAGLGLKKSVKDLQEQDQKSRDRRSALSLGTYIRPFISFGAGFLRTLLNLIRAVVRRIAVSMGLAAHVSTDVAPAAGSVSPDAAASFEGSEAVEKAVVSEAVSDASRDISAHVAQLLQGAPDEAQLKSEGAAAYAAMHLQESGGAVVDLRNELSSLGVRLDEAAAQLAAASGAPVKSMRSYLDGMDFSDPVLLRKVPQEIQDLVRLHAQRRSELCQVQLQFCRFSIVGLRLAGEARNETLERTIKTKVFQFADVEMAEVIFERRDAQNMQEFAGESVNSGLSGIESLKSNTGEVARAEVVAPAGRSRWAGMSVGVTDVIAAEIAADEGIAPSPLRERVRT